MADYSNALTLLFPIKAKDGVVYYYRNHMNKFGLYDNIEEDIGKPEELDCSEYTSKELSLFFYHIDNDDIEETKNILKSMSYNEYVRHFEILEFFQYYYFETLMDDVHTIVLPPSIDDEGNLRDDYYYDRIRDIGLKPFSLFCISKLYYCLKYGVSWQDLYRPWIGIPWWEEEENSSK